MARSPKARSTVLTSVSAIITTRNRLGLLQRALDSVRAQEYPVSEVVVSDDGSTDGTVEWLQQQNDVTTVLAQSSRGISAARNAAIQAAQGEWLAFLDDDDEWLPNKTRLQMAVLEAHNGDRLCHGEEIWIRNGKRVNAMHKHRKQGGWIYPMCLPLCVISPSAAIIHRNVFTDIGLFDTGLPACEDYDMWLRICSREPVAYVEQPLIRKYGGHADQLSRKYWGMDRFRIQALEKILDTDSLRDDWRRMTIEVLLEKSRIYLQGASKRDKLTEAAEYRQRIRKYKNLLDRLAAKESMAC